MSEQSEADRFIELCLAGRKHWYSMRGECPECPAFAACKGKRYLCDYGKHFEEWSDDNQAKA